RPERIDIESRRLRASAALLRVRRRRCRSEQRDKKKAFHPREYSGRARRVRKQPQRSRRSPSVVSPRFPRARWMLRGIREQRGSALSAFSAVALLPQCVDVLVGQTVPWFGLFTGPRPL